MILLSILFFSFALNMLISFFLIAPLQQKQPVHPLYTKLLLCLGLFTVICIVFAQLTYGLRVLLPTFYLSIVPTLLICIAIIVVFFTLVRLVTPLTTKEYKAVFYFVSLNTISLFVFFNSPIFTSCFFAFHSMLGLALVCVLSFVLSLALLDKLKREISGFSLCDYPAIILSIGLVLFMLLPVWVC